MIQRTPLSKSVGLLALTAALVTGSAAFGASTGTAGPYTPQGSGTPAASGDYLTTNNPAGLNTFYRYFIEVPPGLARLRVQIWDADVGEGGTTEAAAGRDRGRGNGGAFTGTSATYTLLDPTGTARPVQFTTGDTTTPAGADNTWLSLYDGRGNNVLDNFTTAAFTNNNGNQNWAAAWIETDAGGVGAATGAVTVTGGQLRIRDNVGGTPNLAREANLTGLNFQTAYFTFDWGNSGNLAAGDSIAVQVSNNGGTSYTTLETLTDTSTGTSRSYNITSFIAANTRIRFQVAAGLNNNTRFYFFDNVQIYDGGLLTAGHWELRVDESSAVTTGMDINAFGVQADDGDSTSGGTEIPIYIDSQNEFGVNAPASGQATRAYTAYPYVTSGCTALENDFDYDSNQADNVGSVVFTSRTGVST
ncbi:MAG: large repetitive protein, partial [Acidobacteriota bacterium]|nr:large repetitive protein [Acidobacteriota bacterium]